jgi:hypothetical protein
MSLTGTAQRHPQETTMMVVRRLFIAGCFAASMVAVAPPARAVDGIRPGCPGWFDPVSYVVCVGRPWSHVRHHHYHHHGYSY